MCGIVGYIGTRAATEIVLSGLKRLEYRGYDSAGVAMVEGGGLRVERSVGKIAALEGKMAEDGSLGSASTLGIGHTRWATHGAPTEANAHPHVSMDGTIAVVHNGIIENHAALRAKLEGKGYVFKSETDTEVLAHLIQDALTAGAADLAEAVKEALGAVRGTYGIAVVSSAEPGRLVAARKGSPIVLGVCEGETFVASDLAAIVRHTNKVVFLDDGDIAVLGRDGMDIRTLDSGAVNRAAQVVDFSADAVEKGGYEHFMLKEIFEQPEALGNTIRGRLVEVDGTAKLAGLQLDPRSLAAITNIVLTACGTSYYAGLVGAYAFEQFAELPARVEQAAEFRYRNPIVAPDTALIAISQSGETADTLAATREAKRKGALVLAICNAVGSTIAREAGRGVYLHAGPEIGVASTKAFCCQVAVLVMMALLLGRTRHLSNSTGTRMVREIRSLPELVRRTLEQEPKIRAIAERYAEARDFFYIGRGYMFPAAMEGALKLKEISYIHAEGYHAAELKHGPIALLEESVPVVACVPRVPGYEKALGNIQECRARRSPVIAIATEGDGDIAGLAQDVIEVPACPDYLAAVPVVVAEQLLAYHIARLRGEAIDQPRNLAKSVTVE
ncbi:MAG: glutamine--fructose-6-phosphate transaminase (isomerizing) [Kiritimatiellae bacterium]|nr:glutamine--fructose-6-phosphate transaminase (isomerizing) [Kiritimatiellia bacterium]